MPALDPDEAQGDGDASGTDTAGGPATAGTSDQGLSALDSVAAPVPAKGRGRLRRQESQPAPPVRGSLRSLTSQFQPEQHGTYLQHLEDAVKDPRNLNIALTGRYGTGKSSILDAFEKQHPEQTTRLAIATLGMESQDKSRTNRIEKALVKQLLYRASPRQLPSSRFSRITPLPWQRAAVESLIACLAVAALLLLFGWMPHVRGTGHEHRLLLQVAAWAATGAIVVALVTKARLVLHERFDVSDVSAAGTAVKLTRRTSTYFDEYLDEIVYFFDVVAPDYVIFEDLDRFNDPGIFEALRELNALLNKTAARRKSGRPLHFIYAIKDSLFEKLESSDPAASDEAASEPGVVEPRDAADEHADRANRTKFFDIVIPVVPFISHRNARELLHRQMDAADIDVVDRKLISLVARHVTDMRLLINICNEYRVFAERLLGGRRQAPGLVASKLFALIVYKNFHLRDFEQIARRSSALDELFDQRVALVRSSIEQCERQRRDVTSGRMRAQALTATAERLGQHLRPIADALGANQPNRSTVHIDVDGERHELDDVVTVEFWQEVAAAGEVSVIAPRPSYSAVTLKLNVDQLTALAPEARDPAYWAERDADRDRAQAAHLDAEIRFLHGAGFRDLVGAERFRTSAEDSRIFSQIVEETLPSELACELVRHGYVDVNFAVYAAQFYGDFTGIDVANFIAQSVQPNKMLVDYAFNGPASIANLLQEVEPDFTRTVSAYNIELVDYLLEHDDRRATEIVTHLIATLDRDARTFLNAYFNSGAQRTRLAALLAQEPWLNVFKHLVTDDDVPDDVRPELFDAGLLEAQAGAEYQLDPAVREFLLANYPTMSAFTTGLDRATASKVAAFVRACGAILPDLSGLAEPVRRELVHAQLFALTGPNLRLALSTAGPVSLDQVVQDEDVYAYCRRAPDKYLDAVEDDDRTPHSVLAAEALVRVLNDVAEQWDEAQLRRLLTLSGPNSKVPDLYAVPEPPWPLLAEAQRFTPTLSNVDAYRKHVNKIDQALADLLLAAGRIDAGDADQEARVATAVAILNAADVLPAAQARVDLASSLELEEPVPVEELPAEAGEFLALLLRRGLVADSAETFEHFHPAGWATFKVALAESRDSMQFLTAELLEGMVGALLRSSAVPEALQQHVVDHLDEFARDDDADALEAAGQYALARERALPPAQLQRIASTTGNVKLTMRLLAMSPPAASTTADIVGALPAPYRYVTTKEQVEFEVPGDDAHRAVFDVLKKDGVVSSFRKKGRLSGDYIAKLRTKVHPAQGRG